MDLREDESVLNFDLQLLHQLPKNNVPKPPKCPKDKQRMALYLVKSKTIATDSVIRKYHAARETLDQTQRTLFTSMEECKQICIEQRNTLDKCASLEENVKTLQKQNYELEQKSINLENRCEGLMCHTNQLQLLVKEYETQIESFKIENKLEASNEKDTEKKYEAIKKEKCLLLKDIGSLINIIFGKKKPGPKEKRLLEKYKKHCTVPIDKSNSDDVDDVFDDAPLHSFSDDSVDNNEEALKQKLEQNEIKSSTKGKLDINNVDNVLDTNDLISVDTGCGSSLASSDSEKCFNSPDYFSADSPSPEVFERKHDNKSNRSPQNKVVQVDRALSPIFNEKKEIPPNIMVDRAVSPCNILTDTPKDTTLSIARLTSPPKLTTCDSSTSPIKNLLHLNSLTDQIEEDSPRITADKMVTSLTIIKNDKTQSPLRCGVGTVSPTSSIRSLSPLTFDHNMEGEASSDTMIISHESENNKKYFNDILSSPNKETTDERCKESDAVKRLQEMECLESNNSCKMYKQQNRDEEIEMILKEMRLTQELITPIPKTPKSKKRQLIPVESCDKSNNCSEASKMREENKALHVTVASLVKEVLNIKTLLKTHLTDENVNKINTDNSLQELTGGDFNKNRNPEVQTHDLSSLPPSDLYESTILFEDENVADTATTFSAINTENSHNENDVSDNIHFGDDPGDCHEDIVTDQCKEKATEKQNKDKATRKKLTKLDKLRKNLLPKRKIKSANPPPPAKTLRVQIKRHPIPIVKEIKGTSAESLNDKIVYEKAIKVMAELNAKKKSSIAPTQTKKLRKDTETDKTIGDTDEIESTKQDIFNSIENNNDCCKESLITTRSRKKHDSIDSEPTLSDVSKSKANVAEPMQQRRGTKRASVDIPDVERKRSLRSSTVSKSNNDVTAEVTKPVNSDKNIQSSSDKLLESDNSNHTLNNNSTDMETKISTVCTTQQCTRKSKMTEITLNQDNVHDNALCLMIQKYGLSKIKYSIKKVSDNAIDSTAKKIEEGIAKIIEMPATDSKAGMEKLVDEMKKWNVRHFVLGLIKYLHDPARKAELFSKVSCPPAPPMTKSEQILLFLITHLRSNWPNADVVYLILDSIEYNLFKLNRSPDFDVIETMAHFYAVLCRYIKAKNRLRIFVMDAMYCIQFKSIPLIKQCIDVWLHLLPLAHMGIAKTPLVTCLVYLLHFFKCEDRYNRVQDIRYILKQKYFYQVTDWNETKILELFKNAILEIRENNDEKKMLRMALILLSKRQGPKWCQNNIIKNMLLHLIEKEDVPDRVKEFCVSMVGPLLKPYPVEMKVHCEITMNQITDILNQNPSTSMQEAIYTSLIYMSKHNPNRVLKTLLQWKPKVMSTEMEIIFKDFVREKPVKFWKTTLSRLPQ